MLSCDNPNCCHSCDTASSGQAHWDLIMLELVHFLNNILGTVSGNAELLSLLELGSGPGFLALHILTRRPGIDYTLLDFSPAMHTLAQRRLEIVDGAAVKYIECDFKANGWTVGLGQYGAVLSNQAVHELRHKRYAQDFFVQVRSLLKPRGILLFCDHYCGEGGVSNDQLYMNLEEQRAVLRGAGFKAVEVLVKGGRALYCARLESKGSE